MNWWIRRNMHLRLLSLLLFCTPASADTVPTITVSQTITAYQARIGFRTSTMMFTKAIALPTQRLGVLVGDRIEFRAELVPPVTLDASDYTWSGTQSGTGRIISAQFNSAGSASQNLTVGGKTITATITTKAVNTPNESDWCASNPGPCAVYTLDEVEAGGVFAGPGYAGYGRNNRIDAMRHAYWNAIMVSDGLSTAEALAGTTAHERTNIEQAGAHNESVMDLENNQSGATIGSVLGPSVSRAATLAAVSAAAAVGSLTVLDDVANQQERGLLKPSN